MLVVFAKNQCIVDLNEVGTTITTDPIAIGDNNQASGTTTVSRILNFKLGVGVSWVMQVSNDGLNWLAQGPASAALVTPAASLQAVTAVSGVYARLVISFSAEATKVGAAILDIQVNFTRV